MDQNLGACSVIYVYEPNKNNAIADLLLVLILSLDHLQFYDNASRGPLGSLNFFWQARRVPWGLSILSYIGCLITIAALALDPFTQQVLAYTNDIRIVQGARSSVPRSQSYDYQGLGATGATNYISMPTYPSLMVRMWETTC